MCWDSKYKSVAKNTPAITANIFIIRFNANPTKKPTMPPKPTVLTNGIMLLSMLLIFFIFSFFGYWLYLYYYYQDIFRSPSEYTCSQEYRHASDRLSVLSI